MWITCRWPNLKALSSLGDPSRGQGKVSKPTPWSGIVFTLAGDLSFPLMGSEILAKVS